MNKRHILVLQQLAVPRQVVLGMIAGVRGSSAPYLLKTGCVRYADVRCRAAGKALRWSLKAAMTSVPCASDGGQRSREHGIGRSEEGNVQEHTFPPKTAHSFSRSATVTVSSSDTPTRVLSMRRRLMPCARAWR